MVMESLACLENKTLFRYVYFFRLRVSAPREHGLPRAEGRRGYGGKIAMKS